MSTSRFWQCAVIIIAVSSSLAAADPHDHHDHRWHGDIHHFHDYDYPHWREGHWHHGDHGGRFGWWWIAANTWYFYPAPIYPYPNPYEPPAVVIEREPAPVVAEPPEATWYYCRSSRNYYPYVSVCPEGWRLVPAQPVDADQ